MDLNYMKAFSNCVAISNFSLMKVDFNQNKPKKRLVYKSESWNTMRTYHFLLYLNLKVETSSLSTLLQHKLSLVAVSTGS